MLQPSELAKIATIIALARYLSDRSAERVNSFGGFFRGLVPHIGADRPDCASARFGDRGFFWCTAFPHALLGGDAQVLRLPRHFSAHQRLLLLRPTVAMGTPYVFATFVVGSTFLIHHFCASSG